MTTPRGTWTRTPHPATPQPRRHARLAATAAHDTEPHAPLPAVGDDARDAVRASKPARGAVGGTVPRRRSMRPARIVSRGAPVAALLALLLWLLTGSYWQTRQARIEGTADPTILALVHGQRLTGCDAFRCDFSAAQQAIAASTRVEAVSVSVVFPNTTLVQITPRQTAALWRAQSQLWAIGADGMVIGSATQTPALANPLAATVEDAGAVAFGGRSLRPGVRVNPALVAMARQLRSSAAGAGLVAASLRYTSAEGFTMQASGSGAVVVFGVPADAAATLADINASRGAAPAAQVMSNADVTPTQAAQGAQAQAQVAGALLRTLAQRGVSASLIDVRWGSHPYYR